MMFVLQENVSSSKYSPKKLTAVVKTRNGKIIRKGRPASNMKSRKMLSNRSRHVSKRSLSNVARIRSKHASSKRSLSNAAIIRTHHALKRSLSRVTKRRSSSNARCRSQDKGSTSKIAKTRSRSPAKRSTSIVDRTKRSVSKGRATLSRSAKNQAGRRR